TRITSPPLTTPPRPLRSRSGPIARTSGTSSWSPRRSRPARRAHTFAKRGQGRYHGRPWSRFPRFRRACAAPAPEKYDVRRELAAAFVLAVLARAAAGAPPKEIKDGPPLPGTESLTLQGDIASQLLAGVDRFLLRKLDESVERRARHWRRDFSSAAAYQR